MRVQPGLLLALPVLVWAATRTVADQPPQERRFSFAPMFRETSTLGLTPPRLEGSTAHVNGSDSARPGRPFTFDWGDGFISRSFFPASHAYADTSRNYVVKVTADYGSSTDTQQTVVRFRPRSYTCARDSRIPRRVRVASEPIPLATTHPPLRAPTDLTGFADADLAIPRSVIEYVLDVGHFLQKDFCNGDVDTSGGLDQVVFNQPKFGGAFSLWFTKPVAMGANPGYLSNPNGISSLFHEMGHNLTLNSPASYRFGGKTDGPMNTIVSETLAQVMQMATAWEILNQPGHYGLSADLADAVRDSATQAFRGLVGAYRRYQAAGCPFTTRQTPGAKEDPTLGTFLTMAYVFGEQIEAAGACRTPLKRMMRLLQTFGPQDHARYQQRENDAFRATFMVAAMSYGFDRDLRPRFRSLKFAIDDAVYDEMLGRMTGSPAR